MKPQLGKHANIIHILPNISRNKNSQTIKFGQLLECNQRNIYIKNEARRLVPYHFLFFKKASYEVKASGLPLSFF